MYCQQCSPHWWRYMYNIKTVTNPTQFTPKNSILNDFHYCFTKRARYTIHSFFTKGWRYENKWDGNPSNRPVWLSVTLSSQALPRPLPGPSQTLPRPLPGPSQALPRPLPGPSQTLPRSFQLSYRCLLVCRVMTVCMYHSVGGLTDQHLTL